MKKSEMLAKGHELGRYCSQLVINTLASGPEPFCSINVDPEWLRRLKSIPGLPDTQYTGNMFTFRTDDFLMLITVRRDGNRDRWVEIRLIDPYSCEVFDTIKSLKNV